jgi:chromosome segregation ATPase
VASERFNREATEPRLAAVPGAEAPLDREVDASELLSRLERQAAESGRLEGRVDALELALKTERDARRRLADTLKRERKAAEALHARAQHAEAASEAQTAELVELRQGAAAAEGQIQVIWMQLADAERQLAAPRPSLWRRLFSRRSA